MNATNPLTSLISAAAMVWTGWTAKPQETPPQIGQPVPPRARYLLLDSRLIDRREHARLVPGEVVKHPANPLFVEDRPWEVRFDNLYPNVVYDPQQGLYQCWYSPFIVDDAVSSTPRKLRPRVKYQPRHRETGLCYTYSRDGLHWIKPQLGLVEFNGNKQNNLVLRRVHGAGIYRDEHESDPLKRYKLFGKSDAKRELVVAFSADGLHWSEPVGCPEAQARADTHNNAFWAPEQRRYVGITRLFEGQRLVARTESRDFLHWSRAVEVLRGDRNNQTYAMPAFRYADVYLGLVMILRRDEDRVHCELAWSPDTIHWHRIAPGTSFIPNSEREGDYDWGCVYAAFAPVFLPGEIRLYYGASNGKHTSWRDGCLALATLRPDGFAGYEPDAAGRQARLVTRPLRLARSVLRVTADAGHGEVRVAVLDQAGQVLARSRPIRGDVTDAPVQFDRPSALASGRTVTLLFEFENARIYSFTFTDQ